MNEQGRSSGAGALAGCTLNVRLGGAHDAARIAAFNVIMARETEGLDLAEGTVHAGVSSVLADPAHGFYVVAERAGRLVGALLITYEWSDWRNGRFWWIQSVFVIPEARRQGVYQALHAFVSRRAREEDGVCGLRLYVEMDNVSAQNAYRATGMHDSGYRLYEEIF
jgi:GNAT superfamily N-acetyltransferase